MRTKHRVLRMDQSASSNSSAHKTLRQTHILKSNRLAEQRGDFFVPESGNAAADASHIEEKLRMLLRKCDERSNVRLDGLHTTLHSGDSVALATKTNAATHYGSELFPSSKRRTDIMSGVKSGRSILLYVLILYTKVQRIPGKAAENYGSVTTSSWLLLQKAKAPFTRSTRAPTYKATEIIISSMAYIICCCKANTCLCQDIAQALNPGKSPVMPIGITALESLPKLHKLSQYVKTTKVNAASLGALRVVANEG